MLVSYNWLQEYFEEKLPAPEELGKILTDHIFEIEGVEKVGGDYVIDVDVLPNRSSDALSHRGVAREIATILDRKLKYDPLREEALEVDESKEFEVEVGDNKLCSRYALAVVEGIKVGPSPKWLKEKLEALGQRSINNIVDATNYVMLNTGQPLHAFDAEKLGGGERKKIIIRKGKLGEKITTLTDDEYELDERTLLITDGNSGNPIGIAGVKGGKIAEVDENTKDIVIESAHFDFTNIRKTAQRLKLWTDASTRFQNNPSQHLVGYALADVVELILDIAGGEVEGAVDICEAEADKAPVSVSVSQANNLLGLSLSAEEISKIFDRFDFEYELEGETFTVTPPFERTDINIYEDLIEEIGRVHGFEHLEAKALPEMEGKPVIHKEFAYTDKVANILNKSGFSEILGYTFVLKGDIEAIAPPASDKAFLRTNLRDGMKGYLDKNEKNAPILGLDRVKIFEIGRVFPKSGEYLALGLAVSGKKTDKILTGVKETLEKELGTKISENPKEGMLEINLTNLIDKLPEQTEYYSFEQNLKEYEEISLYPFILRDLAVWIPSSSSESDITEVVSKHSGDLLKLSTKFDEFEKDGRTSYAYHLVFQSHDRTLTDVEIGEIMDKITSDLNKKEGFEVR